MGRHISRETRPGSGVGRAIGEIGSWFAQWGPSGLRAYWSQRREGLES